MSVTASGMTVLQKRPFLKTIVKREGNIRDDTDERADMYSRREKTRQKKYAQMSHDSITYLAKGGKDWHRQGETEGVVVWVSGSTARLGF